MAFILTFVVIIQILESCYGRANLTCTKNSDCPLNASCEGGHVCFCNEGYIDDIEETLRCLKEATKYEDYCEKDVQCTGMLGLRSHCRHTTQDAIGRCICNSDSHYREGICHRNSFVGDYCVVSDDCILRNQDLRAYCYQGKCICPPKLIPSQDRKDCLPQAGLNERCSDNTTCIVLHSECAEYCQCKVGYVASKDNKRCLTAADTLNDACEEDAQCTEFLKLSRCDFDSKKCACRNFTHRLDDQCWLTVELEGLCEHNSECFVSGDRSGVECKGGSCLCKKGFTSLKGNCFAIAQAGFGRGNNSSANLKPHFSLLLIILSVTRLSSNLVS